MGVNLCFTTLKGSKQIQGFHLNWKSPKMPIIILYNLALNFDCDSSSIKRNAKNENIKK